MPRKNVLARCAKRGLIDQFPSLRNAAEGLGRESARPSGERASRGGASGGEAGQRSDARSGWERDHRDRDRSGREGM